LLALFLFLFGEPISVLQMNVLIGSANRYNLKTEPGNIFRLESIAFLCHNLYVVFFYCNVSQL